MTNSVDVDTTLLVESGKKWINDVSPALSHAADAINELKYSAIQFGRFVFAWQAYIKAASYIQDRLREGAPAAEEIGSALYAVAQSFDEQQAAHKTDIQRLDTDIQNTGNTDFAI
ncbi:hypothetical protein [Nocardia farcinica]|uniref:hypothetical protein n=1 Tax=Nocardia farcinica TaxID=37329 RepID=UPI00245851FC|nr:hypothetical protein [Nocardia farcinica]